MNRIYYSLKESIKPLTLKKALFYLLFVSIFLVSNIINAQTEWLIPINKIHYSGAKSVNRLSVEESFLKSITEDTVAQQEIDILPFNRVQYNEFVLKGNLDLSISGNLLGGLVAPQLYFQRGYHTIYSGPLFQQINMKLGGVRLGYSFNITGGDYNALKHSREYVDQTFYLNAFLYYQYTNGLYLSNKNRIIEERGSWGIDIDWTKYKLKTNELCIGVDLNVRILEQLVWNFRSGISLFNNLNHIEGMWNEGQGCMLLIGTGITAKIL
ncbi:MAG: hypothetical protein IPM51_04750 [Sphingobacteriaceae bacterium]|nr:hypothetical protein [Sphingobacteriaceae bacterium]